MIIAALAALSGAASAQTIAVTDGDTIVVNDQAVRLSGFDAPETGQLCADGARCGEIAARALVGLLGGRVPACAYDGTEHGNRLIAVCETASGIEIGAWMVSNGFAVDDPRYAPSYDAEMREARNSGRGLWPHGLTSGRDHRLGVAAIREDCAIKGNISRSGRIYHVPGVSPSYSRTVIDTSVGERWFCSIADAEQAGFRAPRG